MFIYQKWQRYDDEIFHLASLDEQFTFSCYGGGGRYRIYRDFQDSKNCLIVSRIFSFIASISLPILFPRLPSEAKRQILILRFESQGYRIVRRACRRWQRCENRKKRHEMEGTYKTLGEPFGVFQRNDRKSLSRAQCTVTLSASESDPNYGIWNLFGPHSLSLPHSSDVIVNRDRFWISLLLFRRAYR